TFGATLRSILRQDPDIILVGEIRDVETAEISIQASLTGHLVLTTLHTNEAAGSITRLIDMGIEPFLLTSTILAVCGQRLVRTICPMCKEVADIDKEKLKLLAPPNTDISKITLYRGRGCEECTGTGYKGRTGIFELFIMSEEIQELVLQKAPANVLHAKAQELGMVTMAMDGWNKVMQGITTLEEVHRVAPLKTS
ncbi:TPA: type II secretion system protein GspE, partial [bacterium]|nr:type II secretion system protein GspE [bacterium]